MWFIDSTEGILTLELLLLVILVFVLSYRLSGKKAQNDMDVMSDFLDNIDKESLIKIGRMDERSSDHGDTINDHLKTLSKSNRLLKRILNNTAVRKQDTTLSLIDYYLTTITKAFMKIIIAIKAISDRKNTKLQKQNEELNKKLTEASKMLDGVANECASIISGEEYKHDTSEESRQRILCAIADIEQKNKTRKR